MAGQIAGFASLGCAVAGLLATGISFFKKMA